MRLDPKLHELHRNEFAFTTWLIRVPAECGYSSVFDPETWISLRKKGRHDRQPKRDDLMRVIGSGYDVLCLVVGVGDDGYQLKFFAGLKPNGVSQVLSDLDALPEEIDGQAEALRKRWRAGGITEEEIRGARKQYAKQNHPDANATDGHRLAKANALLDAALANPEAP